MERVKHNRIQLMKVVIEASVNKEWSISKEEWDVVNHGYDEEKSKCICSNCINETFMIKNIINDKVLFPIGNVCIRNFQSPKMNEQMRALREIRCEFCNTTLANKTIYKKHLLTPKHIKKSDTRKCMECNARIPQSAPDWKVRCMDCYTEHEKVYCTSQKKRASVALYQAMKRGIPTPSS